TCPSTGAPGGTEVTAVESRVAIPGRDGHGPIGRCAPSPRGRARARWPAVPAPVAGWPAAPGPGARGRWRATPEPRVARIRPKAASGGGVGRDAKANPGCASLTRAPELAEAARIARPSAFGTIDPGSASRRTSGWGRCSGVARISAAHPGPARPSHAAPRSTRCAALVRLQPAEGRPDVRIDDPPDSGLRPRAPVAGRAALACRSPPARTGSAQAQRRLVYRRCRAGPGNAPARGTLATADWPAAKGEGCLPAS